MKECSIPPDTGKLVPDLRTSVPVAPGNVTVDSELAGGPALAPAKTLFKCHHFWV